MFPRATSRRAGTAILAIVILAAASIASSSAVASSTLAKTQLRSAHSGASPKTKAATKSFCAGAKTLAALNTKTLKDITSSVNVTAPGYVSKQFGDTLASLHVMYLHAPAAILPTSKQYVNAYIDYGKQIGEVHWSLQPTDPGEQKIVTKATLAYAPVATADLPKLDSFVKKTCGFGLNLLTTPPK